MSVQRMEAAPERCIASAVADSGESSQQMEAAPERRVRIRIPVADSGEGILGVGVLNVDPRSEEDAD
jgi:hypothetical protein